MEKELSWVEKYVNSVNQMRHYQREFFRTRDRAKMESAKGYEAIVDRMTSEWEAADNAEREKKMNPTLF